MSPLTSGQWVAWCWVGHLPSRGNRTLVLYRHSPRGSVGSLSLQRLEKRIGAGNIKTGGA